MDPTLDSYYSRKEVSNSDLSWLKNQLNPRDMPDPTMAYRFGNLIDAMITEQHRVNYFKRTCDNIEFTREEFEIAEKMKKAFYQDELCRNLTAGSDTQKVMSGTRQFNYQGIEFKLSCRCKWDIWKGALNFGGDIKSTTATSQQQFEDVVKYFDYDRQRAWYMDLAGSKKDILIGISKVNFKIFKIIITRNHPLYRSGFEKYNELAYKWNLLFN